jgi:hypothetical protein
MRRRLRGEVERRDGEMERWRDGELRYQAKRYTHHLLEGILRSQVMAAYKLKCLHNDNKRSES